MSGCAAGGSPPSAGLPENDAELAAYLRDAAAGYQRELEALPKDLGVAVSVATYDTVVELTFRYRRENAEAAAAIARFTDALLLHQGCADDERLHWMERGVIFRFTYRDRNNGVVLRRDIDKEICDAVRRTQAQPA